MASKEYRLKKLVAEGCVVTSEIRALEKKKKAIVAKIKPLAKELKIPKVETPSGNGSIQSQATSSCDTQDLKDLLVELGRDREFVEMVTPSITVVRARLGSISEEIINTNTNTFAKVVFYPKS